MLQLCSHIMAAVLISGFLTMDGWMKWVAAYLFTVMLLLIWFANRDKDVRPDEEDF